MTSPTPRLGLTLLLLAAAGTCGRATEPLLTLRGHSNVVYGVAFSPDGKHLASAGNDSCVKVWDATTGRELFNLQGHAGGIWGVTFSPDGTRLASAGSDQTVRVWDAVAGKEALVLRGHNTNVYRVVFSPDGRFLAAAGGQLGRPGEVKVWEAATGKEIHALRGHTALVSCVAFSPDGKRLASGGLDHTLLIWDVATGKVVMTLSGHTKAIYTVAFSPDGKRLVSATGNHQSKAAAKTSEVKVWDANTGQEVLALSGQFLDVFSVAFSPDGKRLATGSGEYAAAEKAGEVKVWDATTGQEAFTVAGHTGPVLGVAFSPDGRRLASTGRDRTVKVWDVTGRGADRPVARLSPQELDRLHADLAGTDAARAYRAVWALAAVPAQSVPLLKQHLGPAPAVDARQLARWVADLDSERFFVREKASEELEKQGEAAEAVLRKVLLGKPPVEVRKRVERLLERLDGTAPSPERLYALRAIEVLEYAGTPEAREVLEKLARDGAGTRLAQDVRAALERLARRSADMP